MPLTSSAPTSLAKDTYRNQTLVILDAGIENLPSLMADLSDTDFLVLDPTQDGITQITAVLETCQSISSLHLVAHASPGQLRLGNTQLSYSNLNQYAGQLKSWARVLQGGDILLYGCRVAAGALGHLFLQQLHQFTGANLAASKQPIGRVGSKRNWELDTQLGKVQTPLIFSEHLQANYSGRFETVNFSTNTDTVIESEGTLFSFMFEVDGAIPSGGSVIRLEGSIPQAINQFDLFQLDFSGLAGQPEDVSPNLDFSAFEITIVEPTASINLPVFNDFVDDSPQEITWTVTPVSLGTTVSDGSATVTIFDDPSEVPSPPSPEPEVSLTSDMTTLVEDEGTDVTFTLGLNEPPPSEGLLVDIGTGQPFALGDFDVFPPPPQASATGGQLVAGFPDNSGFTFAIQEQTATITLPIFDDPDRTGDGSVTDPNGPLRNDDIGVEQITFSIAPGDGFTIAPDSGSVTLTLADTRGQLNAPVAEDDAATTTEDAVLDVVAAEGLLANDSDAEGDNLNILEVNGEATLVGQEITLSSGALLTVNEDGSYTYDPNGQFDNLNSGETVTDSFEYTVTDNQFASEGELNTDTAIANITINGVGQDIDPTEPVVSFSTTPEVISEAEGNALVLNFNVDGNIPAEGIEVSLTGDFPRILREFTAGQVRFDDNLEPSIFRFDEGVANSAVGGELDLFALDDDPNSDGFFSDFSFTINEPTASLTFPVLDDVIEEEDATFTYTLADGEGFSVDPQANSSTFTVTDGVEPNVGPTIGVTATPTELIESEQTRIELTFTATGELPAEGVVLALDSGVPRAIAEFDVTASNPRDSEDELSVQGPVVTGGNIVGSNEFASSLLFRMTEPTATLSVEVFEDDVAEGLENFTFELLDGEGYEVDPDASAFSITIDDDVDGDDGSDLTADIVGTDAGETLVGDETDNIIDALGGNDTVAGGLGNDVILGGSDDDILRGDRNSRSTQDGEPGGDDIIFGGAGSDRIGGKTGNDILSGDAGDDQIWGDDGDDIIMGVTGNDILVGDNFSDGSGSDLFVFGNGDGTDTILDFEVGIDQIGLVEGELAFEDLTLTQDGNNTLLGVASSGEVLAVLNDVQASALNEDSFATVPDVSNPQEALQII